MAFVVGVISSSMLQACTSAPDVNDPTSAPRSDRAADPTVLLNFEGAPAGAETFRDEGQTRGNAVVKTVDGGRLTIEPRLNGDHAIRFPKYDASQRAGRAVLVMEPPAGDTRLDPGDDEFEFGADFALDGVSEGHSSDNGNNLVQRGLASDPTQYKLQVEHRRASCRVAGSTGEIVVSSTSDVVTGKWYTVTCARKAGAVTLTLRPEEGGDVERVSEPGVTGSLTYPSQTPLVVGGKVSATGAVISKNSDQFNGSVDNVFLRIG